MARPPWQAALLKALLGTHEPAKNGVSALPIQRVTWLQIFLRRRSYICEKGPARQL